MTTTNDWDQLTPLETESLALIRADLGWEPKSARGFIAGFLWGKDYDNGITHREIADAYYEWFYSLKEGTCRWYRSQDNIDLTRR